MKKKILFFLWILLSCIYLFLNMHNFEILSMRLNLWLQMTITGFVLASSGAVLQIILHNPIIDPWLLGVSGASSLGSILASIFQLSPILFWRTMCSFIGSSLSLVGLSFFSMQSACFNIHKFVLIGVGINAFCSSLIVLLQGIFAPNDFFISFIRISGHFVFRSLFELIIIIFAFFIMYIFLFLRKNELSVLQSGEEMAFAVGVLTIQVKYQAIMICAIALAIVVSISGSIGFIGLSTPHIIRSLFGEKYILYPDYLIPVSGILMLSAAIFVRFLPIGIFVPIGSAVSLIGAPMFIYILYTNSKLSNQDIFN